MGANSLRVDQVIFERYKTFCVLHGCSNASAIDCKAGGCDVHEHMRIEVFKRRAGGLGYR